MDPCSTLIWESGNIDADPCFLLPGYWDPNDTPGDANDDFWVDGDYHLLADSSCNETDLDGNPRVLDGDSDGNSVVDIGAYEHHIIYVDADANGVNDGSSWADAFNYLQDALAVASSGSEIWVAAGTYRPDCNSAHPGGTGDREATFQLIGGVAIRGSYAGYGEADPDARDVISYETILSGDLAGDDLEVSEACDLPSEPSRAENSYHVVTCIGSDASAVLDALSITGGNANGLWPNVVGAGMYNESGASPKLLKCVFSSNAAGYAGGGMWNPENTSPTLVDCSFSGNWADFAGGGICNREGSPEMTNCTFIGNSTTNIGGAVMGGDGPVLTNCTFVNNSATGRNSEGGAIFRGDPTLISCLFIGNSARSGGALNCLYPTVTNCTFVGNSADDGGAMYTVNATVTNCTFGDNSASRSGGGMRCFRPTLRNCIFWGNRDSGGMDESGQIHPYQGTPIVSYSCIQGWTGTWGGMGNIGADPLFVDPNNADYHLVPGSPCIDRGDNNSVPADAADLDGDGDTNEPIPFDLDNNARIVDGNNDGNSVVDMGAYEFFWPPIEVAMKFTPQALNPGSGGRWVKVHFVLPEGFGVEDVGGTIPAKITEPFEPDIESKYMNVFINDSNFVEVEAAFGRAAFCAEVPAERTLDIMGILCGTSGQSFYGTDTVKITNHVFEYLSGLASYWLEESCGQPDWCGGADLDEDSVVDFTDFVQFEGCCIEVVAE
jgi:predicted outer membrane repeat protein